MIITHTFTGNVIESANAINKLLIDKDFIQFVNISSGITVAVFKTDSYPDTVRLCEKLRKRPPTAEQWLLGEL